MLISLCIISFCYFHPNNPHRENTCRMQLLGGRWGAGLGVVIGATVGTVFVPCVGTAVGWLGSAGIGLFVGTVPEVVAWGWGMVQTARHSFKRSPESSDP